MSKHQLDLLEKRIRAMKPHEKSDPAVIGGALVSKLEVLKEIRSLHSITVGDLREYLERLPEDMEVTVDLPGGSRMNIYTSWDANLQAVERRMDF